MSRKDKRKLEITPSQSKIIEYLEMVYVANPDAGQELFNLNKHLLEIGDEQRSNKS